MKKVILYARGLERVLRGHPWIYRSQIKQTPPVEPGEIVHVDSERKKFIGVGFINPHSEISIRLLSRQDEPIDRAFFEKKLTQAMMWRKKHVPGVQALRWVNSESDGLPGLILDEYAGHFVFQISTAGIEKYKDTLIEIIQNYFHPSSIYEKNDFQTRNFEGLPLLKGNVFGNTPPSIEIEEDQTRFAMDVTQGHKTGFYLDQRDNRKRLSSLVQDKEVLDCFSYTGGFALAALKHGAKNALAVDISNEALQWGRKNAQLNGVMNRWQDQEANGFDLLKRLSMEGKKFDVIILDPPSFTKKRDAVQRALGGYKEINLRAMKMLQEGGLLVTATCSHHIHETLFEEMLLEASCDAKKMISQIYRGTQGLDHPILPAIPETRYLKCFFYEVHSL
ncbi:MAG: class I SAM-dependent rRNA methyltransferase [Chlamydiae bacterium]|nr:class I SAM-dependent rRNA methyltransferase [Chlamydiota bacterium]MBI3265455.1 class I SAM-dependent rRNA methyltransferase [Chlamydiota bacterium]